MSEFRLDSDLAELAGALSALRPAAGGLDRDQLMFAAGKTAGAQQRSRGSALAIGVATVALSMALVLALRLNALAQERASLVERLAKTEQRTNAGPADTRRASDEATPARALATTPSDERLIAALERRFRQPDAPIVDIPLDANQPLPRAGDRRTYRELMRQVGVPNEVKNDKDSV